MNRYGIHQDRAGVRTLRYIVRSKIHRQRGSILAAVLWPTLALALLAWAILHH